jgi:hypothetical protein
MILTLSSRPVFNVHAVVAQAFEDSILMCDRALAARCSHRPFTDLFRPSVSLTAILDLVSLVDLDYYSFSLPLPTLSLDDEAPLTLGTSLFFVMLTPSESIIYMPLVLTYHDVSQPDAAVWRSVMAREIDSLTSP